MIKLADFCYRRRRLVLVLWVVGLVAVFGLGAANKPVHKADYQTPGAESSKAYKLLGDRFPSRGGDTVKLVIKADKGIADPGTRTAVEAALASIATLPHAAKGGVVSPYDPAGASQISADGKIAYAQINLDETIQKLDTDVPKKYVDAVKAANVPGVELEITTFVAQQQLGSEAIGLVFAIFVLLVAFGSVLAMGLPIVTALFGLGIGGTIGGIASHFVMTPDWAAVVATMIGLGVGIDYALFIITRYRVALHQGHDPRRATATAMGTAGRAVLFAGGTVVISLLGMLTMGLAYLDGVVTSSVVAVLVVLLGAMTLLPALLGFAGRSIDRFKLPGTGKPDRQGEHSLFFRWSRVVQHRPWVAFGGAAAVLAVLTLPLFSLRFGFPDDGNNPAKETSRKAYDLLTDAFGKGYNGPLTLAVDLKGVNDPKGFADKLVTDISAQKAAGVQFVVPPVLNEAGDAGVITVFPTTKPQDKATENLVSHLRSVTIPDAIKSVGQGAAPAVYIGGVTAISIDSSHYIGHRLPLFIGAVVFLSFLLLTMVFRSPLVALKAGIMNLLSIGAAYGVMSYAVHGTWLGTLLRIPETPVPAFVPMITFAILFGLSMDYEVFLLSRIREEYLHTGDNGLAVADGLASTARVITAAAAIMVFVFGVFIFDPNTFIKQIGLGLTTAVFVDATVVRMVLVPATMELLGNANWWMPKWLARILPEIHIEGEATLEAELALLVDEIEPVKS